MTTQTNAASLNENPAIEKVLEAYWQGADNQNTETLSRVLHDDYRVIALTAEGNRLILKQDYLDLVTAQKIGGTPRQFALISTDVSGNVAQSRLTLRSDAVTFHDHVTLTKTNNKWQMISNVTQVTPN